MKVLNLTNPLTLSYPLPLTLSRESENSARHFLPTAGVGSPRLSLHPRACPRPARSKVSPARPACRREARSAARQPATLLKFRFRSLAVISRPRALRQTCLLRDTLQYYTLVFVFGMAPRRQGATGERETEEPRGCCVPGDCLRPRDPVRAEDAVRVLCNNDTCAAGRYMHRECFDQWETGVLVYLKSCGRARSWSERQRHQNLWTKKGYDLAFKACGCRCGRGHLKKDLDWAPPGLGMKFEEEKKRRRRARPGRTPVVVDVRSRAFSFSSSDSCSPPSNSSETSASPIHAPNLAVTPGKKFSKHELVSDRNR